MSQLKYGKVQLDIVKTEPGSGVTPVYEGPDFIGDRWTITIVGCINQANINWLRNANADPTNQSPVIPGQQVNAIVPTSVATILHALVDYLSQPRRSLIYKIDDRIVLQSPLLKGVNPGFGVGQFQGAQSYPCDVDGGPYCLAAPEILSVHGDHSVIVRVSYSTLVNESPAWNQSIGNPTTALLSNRWEQEATMDLDAFETRKTTGRAIFRLDLLSALQVNGQQANADDFRSYFMGFATPKGFQRAAIWVKQDDTGGAVDYVVEDRQTPLTLNFRQVSRVEVRHGRGIGWEGLEKAGEGAFDAALGFLNLGDDLFRQGNLIRGVFNAGKKFAPTSTETITVRVFGQPNSKRSDLEQAAVYLMNFCVGPLQWFATVEATIEHDRAGKFVQATCSFIRGPAATLWGLGVGGVGGSLPFISQDFPDDGLGVVASAIPGIAITYPNDGGVRGTSLENLVVQLLSQPYVAPLQPPATRQRQAPGNQP